MLWFCRRFLYFDWRTLHSFTSNAHLLEATTLVQASRTTIKPCLTETTTSKPIISACRIFIRPSDGDFVACSNEVWASNPRFKLHQNIAGHILASSSPYLLASEIALLLLFLDKHKLHCQSKIGFKSAVLQSTDTFPRVQVVAGRNRGGDDTLRILGTRLGQGLTNSSGTMPG